MASATPWTPRALAALPRVRVDFSRFAAVGDRAGTAEGCGPCPAERLAEQVGAKAWSLAEAGVSSLAVVWEQLDLALALAPSFAVVSLGVAEAAHHLKVAAEGDASFLMPLLEDTHRVVGSLRAAGTDVLLVKPLVLANTPAAWLFYGRRPRRALRLHGAKPPGLAPELLRLARVDRRWSCALRRLTVTLGARFVDLAGVTEALVARGSGLAVGMPPQCGEPGDLFADALQLSSIGAELAADRLAEALGVRRMDGAQKAGEPSWIPVDVPAARTSSGRLAPAGA